MSQIRTNSWRVLLPYLRPYAGRFFLAVGTLFFSMLFSLAFPLLVAQLFDAAAPSAVIPSAAAVQEVAKGWTWTHNVNIVAAVLFGSLLAQGILQFFASYNFHVAGERAICGLRKDLYGRLISLPMTFFAQNRVGDLSSRMSSDLTLIQETLASTVPQFIRQGILLVGSTFFLFFISLKLTGVMMASFPIAILVAIIIGRNIRKLSRQAQSHLGNSAVVVEETLQGVTNVKAFGNERHEMARYKGHLNKYLEVMLKGAKLRAAMVSFIIIVVFGAVTLVLWYGATLVQSGEITPGKLTGFVLYTVFVAGGLASFSDVYGQMQKMVGAIERVRELQREPAEAVSPVLFERPARKIHGFVRIEDVTFHYPSRPETPVLRGINIVAKPGQRIALVGPSGAGKSTLVSLLLRFYDPSSGTVYIDDEEAKDYELHVLRGHIAYVPQEILLFGGSIAENIAYGKPNASEEEIRRASALAHCEEFISKFPEGYNTVVGERGIKLSGGQRQRIAIARALLKDPEILILDEATSSLDSESERLIQEALEVLLKGRTSFIIAHRLSTVREADRIYVLEEGRVVESGCHDELMSIDGGFYRRLSEMQFAETKREDKNEAEITQPKDAPCNPTPIPTS